MKKMIAIMSLVSISLTAHASKVECITRTDGKVLRNSFNLTRDAVGRISGGFSNEIATVTVFSDETVLCSFQSKESVSDCREKIQKQGVYSPQYQVFRVEFKDGRSHTSGGSTSTTAIVLPTGNKFYEESSPNFDNSSKKYSVICLEE